MGFTLRAALARLDADAAITVAELVPAVVAWARGPMAPIFGGCLEDRRVSVAEEDVGGLIAGARSAWDAILLDVDNGPDGLTRRGNDRLYSAAGLSAARSALRAGGVLAIWSAAADAKFVRRLEQAGFAVEEIVVKARGGRGARHVIWLGTRL
jgi:spermidine synthase